MSEVDQELIVEYKKLATSVYELAKEIHEQLDGLDEQEDMLKALKKMLELLFDLRREATYEMMILMRCVSALEKKEETKGDVESK